MAIVNLQLQEIKNIATKTIEVSFKLQNTNFSFNAGQYVQLRLKKLFFDDPKGSSRIFSIVSSPNDNSRLTVAFRYSGSGFKRSLCKLPIGSVVEIAGPYGFLTLPKSLNRPLVFVAGGIGIAPFISILRFLKEKKHKYPITLLYSNRDKQNAAYLKELERTAADSVFFNLITVYKLFSLDFVQKSIKNPQNSMWYIAGSPAMVYEFKYNILTNLFVNSNHVFTEEFV